MLATLFHLVSRHFKVLSAFSVVIIATERVGSMIIDPPRLYSGREWSTTFYFANYPDHGFAKRGMLGTILRPLLQAVDDPRLWVLGIMVVVNLAFIVFLILRADRVFPHCEEPEIRANHFIRCAIAIGFAGMMHIANEHGSLDHYGLLLMLAALACVFRGQTLAAALISVFAILLHEAYAVFALPLVLATSYYVALDRQPDRAVVAPLIIAVCTAPVMLAILFWGNNYAATQIPYGVGQGVWRRELIQYAYSYTPQQILAVVWYWLAILTLICTVFRADRSPCRLIYLAMLSPLVLNVLGVDHSRWVGLGFFVALTGFAVLMRLGDLRLPRLSRLQLLGCGVLCLPLGPLSQVHPLPWFL